MSNQRYLPWMVVLPAACWLIVVAVPPGDGDGQMRLSEFGRLPVLERGRVKPMDTLARTSLMIISGAQTYRDEKGDRHSAVAWMLDVMTTRVNESTGSASRKHRAFRVEDPRTVALLELKGRPDSLYTVEELAPRAVQLVEEASRLRVEPEEKLTESEKEVLDLANQLQTYVRFIRHETTHKVFRIENDRVRDLLVLEPRSGYRYGFDEILPRLYQLLQETDRARMVDEKAQSVYDTKILELRQHVQLYLGLARLELDTLLMIPPMSASDDWRPFPRTEQELNASPAAQSLLNVFHEYADGKTESFNRALDSYRDLVDEHLSGEAGLSSFEVFFNNFAPFYHCSVLYVFVGLLACMAWVGYREPLNRAAFWLGVLTLGVHTLALISRMYIQGRPPVTNLYSSAVFIGWGALSLALGLEAIYHNGLGNIVAAVVGSLTMFIAHYLGGSGDTLEMMQAVLDTNFWLATHVTCVTLGYTATFVAGFLGILFIVLGVCTPRLDRDLFRSLGQMIYGVICFAMFLSFVGTVLGGIWADQSWGRFWGWDPKENGALLIVLINALILHARWAGMIKQRGMAVMTVVGNMVTGWSWFGTNQLGVGLHAYGFNNHLAVGLTIFWITQLAFIGMGLVPTRHWRSFGNVDPESASLTSNPQKRARGTRPVTA